MNTLPIATPPWTALGRKLESMCRKGLYDFSLLDGVEHLGIALSGGKDSLALLFLLKAIMGRGFPNIPITAFHVTGAFSCGASVHLPFIKGICKEMGVELIIREVEQNRDTLECYSCSRARRKAIFDAAKEVGCTTVAFGHHKDDAVQTFLMNMLHKGEFAGNLPKVAMKDYGVTIIRPLIYLSEKEIVEFAKMYGFTRVTCQCPVGQNSLRKQTKEMLAEMTKLYPNALNNLASIAQTHGLKKALVPTKKA